MSFFHYILNWWYREGKHCFYKFLFYNHLLLKTSLLVLKFLEIIGCVCVYMCVCVEGGWFSGLAQLDVSFSSPASYFPQFLKTQKPRRSPHRLDSETVAPLPGHAPHSCPCLGTHTLLCGYAFNTQSHSVHPSSDSQTTEIPFYRQGSGGSRKGSNIPDWAPTNSCRAWEEVGGGHQAPRSPQGTCSPGCVPAPWVSHWPALVSCLIFLRRRARDPNTKLHPPHAPTPVAGAR